MPMKGHDGMPAMSRAAMEGRRLVERLHCNACHTIPGMEHGPGGHGQGHGAEGHGAVAPDLTQEGEKVRPEWLYAFLRSPHQIRPATAARMPNFRLTDREALALTLHILADMRDSPRPAEVSSSPPSLLDPGLVEAGEKLMSPAYFDCFSCHYRGNRKPEGPQEDHAPDLIEAGQRLQPDWIARWIRNPQAIVADTRMPTFFTGPESGPEDILGGDEEQQLQALVAAIIALGQTAPPRLDYGAFMRAKARYPDVIPGDGWRLMADMNCAGCHDIRRMHERVVVAPPLAEEGSRVRADWLVSFLRSPYPIRPAGYIVGTAVRMPHFRLSAVEVDAIVAFLGGLQSEGPPPVTLNPKTIDRGGALFGDMRCGACHRRTPRDPIIVGHAFQGPDLQVAGLRLQLPYLVRWLGGEGTADAHPVVPSYGLSRAERTALAAYIGTLRAPSGMGTPRGTVPAHPEGEHHRDGQPHQGHSQ
ncbi:MAG: c-type cytochrome [Candidatus Methylomirabilales bacterium]